MTTREDLREALRSPENRPGLVPTMGALHQGHLELIARSALENPETVVSIFVNPAQFGRSSDLATYPRDLQTDSILARRAGATLIFAPVVDQIYPAGFDTWVEAGGLSSRWEGASRPGHFRGVCTVVAILLNLIRPARAYFGEKDYQQLQVIRRMHDDLALPGEIVGCETVRDADGLALSSRNAQLNDVSRERARSISRSIKAVKRAAAAGERTIERLEDAGRDALADADVAVDYLAIVDPATLEPIDRLDREARLLIAVEIAGVRLIDNAPIAPGALPTHAGRPDTRPH